MHRNIVSYHLEESSHARHRKPTAATEVRCSFEERWVNNSSTKWKDYPAKTWVTGTACSRKLACFGSCALVLPSSLLCWNTFVSYCGDSSESRALYKIAWGQHSLLGRIIVPPVWRGQNQCSCRGPHQFHHWEAKANHEPNTKIGFVFPGVVLTGYHYSLHNSNKKQQHCTHVSIRLAALLHQLGQKERFARSEISSCNLGKKTYVVPTCSIKIAQPFW